MDLQITVDEKKVKHFLDLLKGMDYVSIKKKGSEKKAAASKNASAKATKEHLPFFGLCPDWATEADELRHGGIAKRTKGW